MEFLAYVGLFAVLVIMVVAVVEFFRDHLAGVTRSLDTLDPDSDLDQARYLAHPNALPPSDQTDALAGWTVGMSDVPSDLAHVGRASAAAAAERGLCADPYDEDHAIEEYVARDQAVRDRRKRLAKHQQVH